MKNSRTSSWDNQGTIQSNRILNGDKSNRQSGGFQSFVQWSQIGATEASEKSL